MRFPDCGLPPGEGFRARADTLRRSAGTSLKGGVPKSHRRLRPPPAAARLADATRQPRRPATHDPRRVRRHRLPVVLHRGGPPRGRPRRAARARRRAAVAAVPAPARAPPRGGPPRRLFRAEVRRGGGDGGRLRPRHGGRRRGRASRSGSVGSRAPRTRLDAHRLVLLARDVRAGVGGRRRPVRGVLRGRPRPERRRGLRRRSPSTPGSRAPTPGPSSGTAGSRPKSSRARRSRPGPGSRASRSTIFDGRFALSGAQPPEAFVQALDRVAAEAAAA